MKINTKMFEVWGKYLVYSAVMAVGIIGKSPLDFTGHDWKQCVNAIWISLGYWPCCPFGDGRASFFMPQNYSSLSTGQGTNTKLPQLAQVASRKYQTSS